MNCDVIFLSDLRLNNRDSVSDLENIFRVSNNKQYDFVYNSSRNSRGTGILISSNHDWHIADTFRDEWENILGIHAFISAHPFLFISVYGPNHNNQYFFRDLRRCITINPDAYIIIGGDWNLTYSTANTAENIDIFICYRLQAPLGLEPWLKSTSCTISLTHSDLSSQRGEILRSAQKTGNPIDHAWTFF